MVGALACGTEGPWIKINFDLVCGKLSLFTQQGLGGEGRGDGHHPSHAVPSDTWETLNFHCPYGLPAMGLTFTFIKANTVCVICMGHKVNFIYDLVLF